MYIKPLLLQMLPSSLSLSFTPIECHGVICARTRLQSHIRLPCISLKTQTKSVTWALTPLSPVLLSLQNTSSLASESSTTSALTPRQARVPLALAQGATITAATAAASLHRSTIHRWLNTQALEEAVRQTSAGAILALHDEPKDLRAQALAAVQSLLTDPQTPTAERLRLAFAILERTQFPLFRRHLDGAQSESRQPTPPAASHPEKSDEIQQSVNACNRKTNF